MASFGVILNDFVALNITHGNKNIDVIDAWYLLIEHFNCNELNFSLNEKNNRFKTLTSNLSNLKC